MAPSRTAPAARTPKARPRVASNILKIGIDLDGVCARFDESFCLLLEKLTGKACPFQEPDCWEWPAKRGFSDAEEQLAWTYVTNCPYWWDSLSSYPDSRVNFRDLEREGHEIYFITARHAALTKYYSALWLTHHYEIDHPVVICTKEKGQLVKLLRLDVFIDDKPELALEVKLHSPKTRVYLRDRQFNQPMQDPLAKHGIRVTPSLKVLIDLELSHLRQSRATSALACGRDPQ